MLRTVAAAFLLILALTSAVPAQADGSISSQNPIEMLTYIPCAGELVSLSGTVHSVTRLETNDNGIHVESLFNPQGISGVGLTTGDNYVGTGVTRSGSSATFETFPYTYTYVNNYRFVGQGTGNNYLVHWNFHQTFLADGTLTSWVDNYSYECK